jgi:hypothetical protein
VREYGQTPGAKHDLERRYWLDVEIDLERTAGHTDAVHFRTLPGPAGDLGQGWGGWSAPVPPPTSPAEASGDGLQ